jgi:cell division protein ZapA (FtsZ GTPase activity inhibitor)
MGKSMDVSKVVVTRNLSINQNAMENKVTRILSINVADNMQREQLEIEFEEEDPEVARRREQLFRFAKMRTAKHTE